jgi:hypothetical protein
VAEPIPSGSGSGTSPAYYLILEYTDVDVDATFLGEECASALDCTDCGLTGPAPPPPTGLCIAEGQSNITDPNDPCGTGDIDEFTPSVAWLLAKGAELVALTGPFNAAYRAIGTAMLCAAYFKQAHGTFGPPWTWTAPGIEPLECIESGDTMQARWVIILALWRAVAAEEIAGHCGGLTITPAFRPGQWKWEEVELAGEVVRRQCVTITLDDGCDELCPPPP